MLSIDSLGVSYGKTPILRDVDIDVANGEIVGIMGKNGVGKTTLVKAIMGLLEADEGRIVFDGEVVSAAPDADPSSTDSTGLPARFAAAIGGGSKDGTHVSADERARRGMGYIPQGRDVFPELTVEENLRMGEPINSGTSEFQYELVYDYFPILDERRDQEAGTMSGGQQQMLAIGRALVGNPDLLLLDEPSEGVQPSIVQNITRDLERVNDELDTTILFVEQNLHVVQNLTERCYAIDKGTIVDELGPDRLESRDAVAEYLAV
ncbi:ABC transporter ATP-binding protein [Halopiger aswanensis]|uniref:Amino acid/amide ABC transporter ATP-binding protein 2 (HAAT family) n=1 Tax=Halopiger aswanensis TaxID=148449 RepID=A0A3R7FT76_9EURY|nr:ABC transporter ATP-binding protein [Halopiger aswanensis]RKD88870.1 amino acid/amide ABC transporter ATP-binding protein 2 (HAAT family) [Halopiger aswanensis]